MHRNGSKSNLHFLILLSFFLLAELQVSAQEKQLIMFSAAAFTPVMKEVRELAQKELGAALKFEANGSNMACRKITDLKKECDVLLLADSSLFKELAAGACSWRIEFLSDEMVLGVGTRAKRVDEAENEWTSVLLDEKISLGRVDENMAPIGYRTLLLWKLQDPAGILLDKLSKKAEKKVDDVATLASLLKSGAIEYGFLYRSTCINYDIRFISLDKKINMGSSDIDYSKSEITFTNPKKPGPGHHKIQGGRISYGVSIPDPSSQKELARQFVHLLLEKRSVIFEKHGFVNTAKPVFFGNKSEFEKFSGIAEYGGKF